jgi:hypothetical protein
MSAWLAMAIWSPYIAGAGIGILIWTVFLLSDPPLGCSTGFSTTAGMIESAFSKGKTAAMPYYQMFVPAADWYWMLVIGLGARWAGGCTSGHGISGTLQLALSS